MRQPPDTTWMTPTDIAQLVRREFRVNADATLTDVHALVDAGFSYVNAALAVTVLAQPCLPHL